MATWCGRKRDWPSPGALLLARGDPRGLACSTRRKRGSGTRSAAAALCYPLYLILLAFPIEIGGTPEIDPWRALAVETIHYVISWVAFRC